MRLAFDQADRAEKTVGGRTGPFGRALLSFWDQAARAGMADNPDVALGEASERLRQLVEPVFAELHDVGWSAGMSQVGPVSKRWDVTARSMLGPPARLETLLWAKQAAGALVATVSQQARDWIRVLTVTGLREGWSPQVLADSLRRRVPLTRPQVETLARLERNMQGSQPAGKIRRLINRQADTYRRDRALTIARTELLTAHNAGAHQAWQNASLEGLIPASTRRAWVISKDCLVCKSCRRMRGDQAIAPDLLTPFRFPTGPTGDSFKPVTHPPGHTRCRCAALLLPPAMSEETVRRIVNPKLPEC